MDNSPENTKRRISELISYWVDKCNTVSSNGYSIVEVLVETEFSGPLRNTLSDYMSDFGLLKGWSFLLQDGKMASLHLVDNKPHKKYILKYER